MTLITDDAVRSLATIDTGGAPVVSCYLDIDGRRHVNRRDYEAELDRMLRDVRGRLNGNGGGSVGEDLARIERFVHGGLDRKGVLGLAIFACGPASLWEVLELAVPVHNELVVAPHAQLGQLERIVQDHVRVGVLLADRQRARMFVFHQGELVDKQELFEELPRDYDDDRGHLMKDRLPNHVDALAQQHLRHAAQVALHEFKTAGFDHLTVGAPDALANELESFLHPYLRDRLVERIPVPPDASASDVRDAVAELALRVERAREAAMVERLRAAVGGNDHGVAGLADTLRALAERRVATLLVSHGFSEPGWRCGGCGHLGPVGRVCPQCGTEMDKVDDVVEFAIQGALAQSCQVVLCEGSADLDVLGRIGALLRY